MKHPLQTYLEYLGIATSPLEDVDSLRAQIINPRTLTADIFTPFHFVSHTIKHPPPPEHQEQIISALRGVGWSSEDNYTLFGSVDYQDE